MEIPRLGVEWELQLPAYTTATAMGDPSHILELRCSSRQRRILNLPTEGGQGSDLHPHGYESGCQPAELQWELPTGQFLSLQ